MLEPSSWRIGRTRAVAAARGWAVDTARTRGRALCGCTWGWAVISQPSCLCVSIVSCGAFLPPLSVHSRVVGCRCRPLRRAHPLRAVWLAPASRFAMRDAVDDVATARLLLVVRLIVYTCWWSLHVLVVHLDVCAAEKVRQRK